MQNLTIYNYMNLTSFLKDFITLKKDNPAYSFRSMSNKIQKISHSHLYQVFSGKRKLPLDLAEDFSQKILKLNSHETRYFKAMVEVDHHLDTIDENLDIKELEKKLELLKPREVNIVDSHEVLLRPLTFILFEMIQRKKYKNIKNIHPKKFLMDIDESHIRASLQILVDLNMIRVDGEGYIHRLVGSIGTKNDVPSQSVRNYHKTMASYSSAIIEIVPPLQREYQNIVLNINQADVPKAKELIRTFVDDFTKLMTRQTVVEKTDSTYSVNINFFPLLKDEV